MSDALTLSRLFCYPIKSTAALELDVGEVESLGLAGDRRWMLVDSDGRFITGRTQPGLVRVRARPTPDGLILEAPGMETLDVAAAAMHARCEVQVWNDRVPALTGFGEADAWFSRFLGQHARLVWMDDSVRRAVDPQYSRDGDIVSFADAYPMLLIPEASLDALNAHLAEPVDMLQFRPNLVVAGGTAFAEHGWRRIRIGEIEFDVAKPCTRCIFTTVSPVLGRKSDDGEPLKTLTRLRRVDGKVVFGMNLIPRNTGRLQVGDPVDLVDTV